MKDRKSAEYIGFRIYKESKTDKKEPNEPTFISQNIVGETQAWRNTREVIIKLLCFQSTFMMMQVTLTLTVPPGVYCIVPSRAEARGEREFLLQVWVDNRWRCDMEEGDQVKVRDYQVKDSSAQ